MQGFGTTIFAETSALAVATGSINLGQGFPDSDGPDELLSDAIAEVSAETVAAVRSEFPFLADRRSHTCDAPR